MNITVDTDWWKHLFDDVYLLTDARSVCDVEVTRREVDLICRILPIHTAHRILDLCGGHGRHSIELCRRGFHRCVVLDFSELLLKLALQSARRGRHAVEVLQADARHVGLTSDSFDCIMVMGNSLGYIPDAEADLNILMEARRLLRPGGWLLLDVADGRTARQNITANAWHEIGGDTVVCRQRELAGDVIHVREMVLSRADGLIRDCGYSIRLYDAADLQKLIARARFEEIQVHTDFSPHLHGGDYGCMNHRMVAVARKAG